MGSLLYMLLHLVVYNTYSVQFRWDLILLFVVFFSFGGGFCFVFPFICLFGFGGGFFFFQTQESIQVCI